jgi:hypothetical protein
MAIIIARRDDEHSWRPKDTAFTLSLFHLKFEVRDKRLDYDEDYGVGRRASFDAPCVCSKNESGILVFGYNHSSGLATSKDEPFGIWLQSQLWSCNVF